MNENKIQANKWGKRNHYNLLMDGQENFKIKFNDHFYYFAVLTLYSCYVKCQPKVGADQVSRAQRLVYLCNAK